MMKRRLQLPPEHIYPVDEWRIVENHFSERLLPQMESIFTTANGYLGIRGTSDEGRPVAHSGTFVNAFYETWPIVYGEEAYGFAKTGQTMIPLPESHVIRLYVGDEPFVLNTARLLNYHRVLDMRNGILSRDVLWETSTGKRVRIVSNRLVSLEHRHLAAVSYEVTVLNGDAGIVLTSELIDGTPDITRPKDPRRGRGFDDAPLVSQEDWCEEMSYRCSYRVRSSGMTLACGADHAIETDCDYSHEISAKNGSARMILFADAEAGKPVRLVKYMTYHTSRGVPTGELMERARWTLQRASRNGFETLEENQRKYLDRFWDQSDVQLEGGHNRLQQCLRWNVFQILQAAACVDQASIPAKGLTGSGYEGHYFWDTEVYVLPFLVYTMPRVASNILRFRHSILDKARQRARELNQRGALFPWRTISGDEASAYYAAGTAQYHINADIVYGLRKYVELTGDTTFLHDYGAEMLVETARLWIDLGFYNENANNEFCINGVTGPDEYNAVNNNNLYTNMLARYNLRYAADVVEQLREQNPEKFAKLEHRTQLQPEEIDIWRHAAERMRIPFDQKRGIHPQDDEFLNRCVWNLEATPAETFPLLLHYHPLVIYRHQVIKQADVVLAMFLLGNEFTPQQKRRNFDYYDPLTTGDSSLSSCIQSIMANEVGHQELARRYFIYAALMDLGDVGRNVRDGIHVASIGGTWMAVVYGFGGMRDNDGQLSFNPRLPASWRRLRFPLMIRGQSLICEFTQQEATYTLRDGEGLTVYHQCKPLQLSQGNPVTVPIETAETPEPVAL